MNLMPKPSGMNPPFSVTTSCWPFQGNLGTCVKVLGYVTQAFEVDEEETAYQTALLFLTESLSLPEFSYD